MLSRAAVCVVMLSLYGLSIPQRVLSDARSPPALSFTVTGPEQTVYNFTKEKCDPEDVPDAAAHAFRDSKGTVHLIAASSLNRAMVGPDLDHLHRDCRIIYQATKDPDPSHFDDAGWLESFYTGDGKEVYGLVSMDYHPDRHHGRCGGGDSTKGACWYATITEVKSTDGGYHFDAPPAGDARFVAGPAQPFSPDFTDTVGALVPSNIVNFMGAYFTLVSVAGDAEQKGGECLMRTKDIHDVKSWRGYDGQDFNLSYKSPYAAQSATRSNKCVRIRDITHPPVRSLVSIDNGFLIIMLDQEPADKKSSIIAQTSTDLIHWTPPVTVMEIAAYRPNGGAKGDHGYYYPSLIDSNSKSPSFDTVGSSAYLYMTKYTYGSGANRDVVRFPLHIERLRTEQR